MKRQLKLFYGTWRIRFLSVYESIASYIRKRTCPHSFRPAIVNDNPSKVCRMCDEVRTLTREEFYAEYGEKYQGMLHR